MFGQGLAFSLLLAAFVWLIYMALEPYVRRRWPQTLIASSTILSGRLRDSVVGRDVLVGAAVGSFLNVCISRIPEGISIVSPSSRCPQCGHPIRFYDNLPVISYLFLLGKCRDCRGRISFRYPLVELLARSLQRHEARLVRPRLTLVLRVPVRKRSACQLMDLQRALDPECAGSDSLAPGQSAGIAARPCADVRRRDVAFRSRGVARREPDSV